MKFNRLNSFLNLSVRVGRLFGIPIDLHITILFFLLPAVLGKHLSFWNGLEIGAAIVLSILLHELGHAFMARRFNLTGLSITLHGFGGFATSSGPRTPAQSLQISLAGPAVTFVLGIVCLLLGNAGVNATAFGSQAHFQFFLLAFIGRLNILLGFLNLIPSFPFDGGNALKAILSRRQSDFKATRAVGHLGLILSPLLAVYGILAGQDYFLFFGLMGALNSYMVLANSGGVRFKEGFDDRRHRQEMEAVRRREEAKRDAFLSDVKDREKEREERERLRRLLGDDDS